MLVFVKTQRKCDVIVIARRSSNAKSWDLCPYCTLPRDILAAQWPWLAVIPVAGNRFLLYSMGRFIIQPTPDNRGHFIQEGKADPEG